MTRPLRALIVDDEPLALRALTRLIAEQNDIDLIASAGDGLEALAVLATEEIDLLVSDIVMPRLAGLELVEQLEGRRMPAVILVSAHAEHAVRAFELGVADYLLKPVSPERLALAIARARSLVDARQTYDLSRLVQGLSPRPAEPMTHLWAHAPSGHQRVAVDDIEVIRAEGDYVRLIGATSSRLADGPLERLATILAGAGFLRVHRSVLVRLDAVTIVRSDPSRRLILVTRSGETVLAGRRTTPDLRERLRVARNQRASDHRDAVATPSARGRPPR